MELDSASWLSDNTLDDPVQKARQFLSDTSGATAIEYCFIAGSVAMLIVLSLSVVGNHLNTYFTRISNGLN